MILVDIPKSVDRILVWQEIGLGDSFTAVPKTYVRETEFTTLLL